MNTLERGNSSIACVADLISQSSLVGTGSFLDEFVLLEAVTRRSALRRSWEARIEQMLRIRGGEEKLLAVLHEIHARRNPKVAHSKGYSKEPIKNEAAWATHEIVSWLAKHPTTRKGELR